MLHVSDAYRDVVVSELRLVVGQMRAADKWADKMFFLSAAAGMIQRVFNIEYDAELLFAHQVLFFAQNQISGRVNQPNTPPEAAKEITGAVISQLETSLEQLANGWEKNEEITDLLKDIAVLGFAVTGNGQYLVLKGFVTF